MLRVCSKINSKFAKVFFIKILIKLIPHELFYTKHAGSN